MVTKRSLVAFTTIVLGLSSLANAQDSDDQARDTVERLTERFHALDTNGDGALSLDEFVAMRDGADVMNSQRGQRMEQMTPAQREQMRERMQSMTPEQRAQMREQMQQRRAQGQNSSAHQDH